MSLSRKPDRDRWDVFASPDFGAGGAIVLVLLVIWLLVIGGLLIGIVKAIKLLRREPTGSKI